MNDPIHIFIRQPPKGKGRARHGKGRVYTPKETRSYENMIGAEAKLVMLQTRRELMYGPVIMTLTAVFAIPKSWTMAKKRLAREGLIYPTVKPDFDNILKITDGLNGVVYQDDCQVVRCFEDKRYGDTPGMWISIQEIAEGQTLEPFSHGGLFHV